MKIFRLTLLSLLLMVVVASCAPAPPAALPVEPGSMTNVHPYRTYRDSATEGEDATNYDFRGYPMYDFDN